MDARARVGRRERAGEPLRSLHSRASAKGAREAAEGRRRVGSDGWGGTVSGRARSGRATERRLGLKARCCMYKFYDLRLYHSMVHFFFSMPSSFTVARTTSAEPSFSESPTTDSDRWLVPLSEPGINMALVIHG